MANEAPQWARGRTLWALLVAVVVAIGAAAMLMMMTTIASAPAIASVERWSSSPAGVSHGRSAPMNKYHKLWKAGPYGADSNHSLEQITNIVNRLEQVSELCGELCDTTRELQTAQMLDPESMKETIVEYKKATTSSVDCDGLVGRGDLLEAPRDTPIAPVLFPEVLKDEFLMGGRVILVPNYITWGLKNGGQGQSYLMSSRKIVWTKQMVDDQIAHAESRTLGGTYGVEKTAAVIDLMWHMKLQGKRVLVVGSERPWLEACALACGAAHVTTLEYSNLVSEDPRITPMRPAAFAEAYTNGELEKFDAVLTFSSLEHSGLGRYGDALNPWGDILNVAKIWCVTKPSGLLLMEVPRNKGKDFLNFNAHRVYGPAREPYLMANWERIEGSAYDARLYRHAELQAP
mmetsp:Transcript_14418/g.31038  ORF Transcript_14418/g.31038 Transcript_14418/m.31038 type:complete len:403 (+) Transcript_14418:184-1392(+)